jgi:hypothetical protein
MERIPGDTLDAEWTRLSWWASIKLALQLRRFIRLLRSVTSPTAGSLDTGKCRSFYLDDYFGLPNHASRENVDYFIKFWVRFSSFPTEMRAAKENIPRSALKGPVPPMVKSFVFTHHDLAPRNLQLDPAGKLWLLDWDLAGFYPVYFEYAAMHNFPNDWGLLSRWRWNLFCWIAVGRYPEELRALERNRHKVFCSNRLGRRFELLSKGGPTARLATDCLE